MQLTRTCRLQRLEALDASNCRLQLTDFSVLTRIQTLSLSANKFGPATLRLPPSLLHLQLASARTYSRSLFDQPEAVTTSLRNLKLLVSLDLSQINLTLDGASFQAVTLLSQFLAATPQLESLHLFATRGCFDFAACNIECAGEPTETFESQPQQPIRLNAAFTVALAQEPIPVPTELGCQRVQRVRADEFASYCSGFLLENY